MRVLITGGCGFLGAAVVRQAIERGDHVLNLDRRRKATPCPQLGNVTGVKGGYARIEADVSDRMLMRSIFREFKPDAVIHLVAAGDDKDDVRVYDSEVGATFAVMEASRAHMGTLQGPARKAFRLIHAVSADNDPEPSKVTPHTAARATSMQLLESWTQAHELPVVTCVAGDVFGPWQIDTALMPTLVCGLLRASKAKLTHGGATVRDWLPVRDFADGILCATKAAPFSRIDFSAGAERRDIELADALCALLDIRSPLPNDASWSSLVEVTGSSKGASTGPMLDDSEAELALGWKPRGFHAGLDRMLNWAMTRYAPTNAAIAAE